MVIVLFLLLILLFAGFGKNTAAYDEFCNLECWSKRKPCCIAR